MHEGAMSKETRIAVVALITPLVMALAGLVNAHAKRVAAEDAKFAMADNFQEYVEYVMAQRGCEP